MLCQRCGAYVTSEDILCPSCGALLDKHGQDSGVRAIRQGRKQPAQPVEEPKRVAHRRSGASRAYTQPAAESTGKVYVDSALSGRHFSGDACSGHLRGEPGRGTEHGKL